MPLDRRHFLTVCSAAGLAGTLLPGALYTLAAQAEQQGSESQKPQTITPQPITDQMLEAAATLAGVPLTAEQRAMMLDGLNQQRKSYDAIRALHIPNSVAPAYVFDPLPAGTTVESEHHAMRVSKAPAVARVPANLEDLGVPLRARTRGIREDEESIFHRADRNVSCAVEALRSHAALRRHTHRGARDDAGA